MKKRLLTTLLSILLFSACDSSRVFEDYVAMENNAWYINHKPVFYVDMQDTLSEHTIYFNLRNTGLYKYSNLFVLLTIQGPNAEPETQRLEFKLAHPDGEWLGSGLGAIYSNQIPMIEKIKFPKKGVYSFTIEQNMRENPLKGIEDIGIRIERVK